LKYDRLKNLTNKEAKIALKNNQNEKVLNVNYFPDDVNKKKFFLLFVLLGWFGIYNIYIGKRKRGLYSLISFSAFLFVFTLGEILIYNGIDTSSLQYYIIGPFSTFAVFGIFIWFYDLISLITRSFKFPVAMSNEDYLNYVLKSNSINIHNKKQIQHKNS